MITPTPSIDVCQLKADTNQIVVLHKAALFDQHEGRPFYSGNVTVGAIEKYTLDAFMRCGLDAIRRSLEEFPNRTQTEPCPPSELDRMSKKLKRSFFANHRMVGIGPEDGMLRLDPVYHEKVGVKGGSREPSYVPLDVSPEEFMRALQECFDRAD
jgi:hypothetical protein